MPHRLVEARVAAIAKPVAEILAKSFRGMAIDALFENDLIHVQTFWFLHRMTTAAGEGSLRAEAQRLLPKKKVSFTAHPSEIIRALQAAAPCECVRRADLLILGEVT